VLLCFLVVQVAQPTQETSDGGPDLEPGETATLFYRRALAALATAGVPHLVGGGFAFAHYTRVRRYTKDLDLFVRPQDAEWAVGTIAEAGYRAEIVAPHWLGKAYSGQAFVDIIFSSGNGVCVVDDQWLEHAEPSHVLGMPVLLSPVEEMIWSKAFVLERERYDGADIGHLLRARGPVLDWERIVRRFEPHWHVLLSHLVLFWFTYPSERPAVPRWVMRELLQRLDGELDSAVPDRPVCQGTLLSSRQYLVDVEEWGLSDARLDPEVQMTKADVALLTRSIRAEEANGRAKAGGGR
jgi:hypothetical protein